MENETKKFPLNNIVELIIKTYAPDIKVTQQNNKSTVTYYIENLKLQIQTNDKKLKNLRQKFLVKRENRVFELNRGLFYKKLFNNDQEHSVTESKLGKIKEFWTNIYSSTELNKKEDPEWLDLTGKKIIIPKSRSR